MEREIKFTTDGKKVIVLGSLNSQEKIVQEIFIVDGSEIPSGEHFVVKSLHDAPAISWKEKELKELEERYERESRQYKYDIDTAYKAYKERAKELRAKLIYMGAALKKADEKSFETLVDYITGGIKWIVVDHYNLEFLPIDKFHEMYKDKLRLVSLFGEDDGTFTYAIGAYYDISGGNKKFYPFKNYDEALEKFKGLLLTEGIDKQNLALAEKYNIQYSDDQIKEYKDKQIESFSKNIDSYKSQINLWEKSIEEVSKM